MANFESLDQSLLILVGAVMVGMAAFRHLAGLTSRVSQSSPFGKTRALMVRRQQSCSVFAMRPKKTICQRFNAAWTAAEDLTLSDLHFPTYRSLLKNDH